MNQPDLRLMKQGTVTVELTTQEDNLTDLANLYARMGFVAGMTEAELTANIVNVIQEEYFKAIYETPTQGRVPPPDAGDVEV